MPLRSTLHRDSLSDATSTKAAAAPSPSGYSIRIMKLKTASIITDCPPSLRYVPLGCSPWRSAKVVQPYVKTLKTWPNYLLTSLTVVTKR